MTLFSLNVINNELKQIFINKEMCKIKEQRISSNPHVCELLDN